MLDPSNKIEIIKKLSKEKSKRFGETFLVKLESLEELFVLKTVEKINTIGLEQLLNEAKFDFNLNGLPKIIKVEETNTHFSILKKYETGITLDLFWTKVKRYKRLETLAEIVNCLLPLFQELNHQNTIHCDIKPENILVNVINGHLQCSLIDFGLAIQKEELTHRKTLFQLVYSSPELILNRLNCANFGTDVFSFCLVCYKLLNGKLPFSSSNPALLTQLQITYPIEKPFKIKKRVWKVLEKGLIKHTFKKLPSMYTKSELDLFLIETQNLRYQNFEEFAKEFKRLISRK